jgi:hypothetical protein
MMNTRRTLGMKNGWPMCGAPYPHILRITATQENDMPKLTWKAGDWAVFDLEIVQIKTIEPYVEVTTGIISTSGNLLDRLRPLTLRNKVTVETFEYYYKELSKLRGERGFNYPDISRLFCGLALQAIDGAEDDRRPYDNAQAFVRDARDYKPVIQGIHLFRDAA